MHSSSTYRILFLLSVLITTLGTSCQKEKALSVDPNFIGTWKFIEHPNRIHYISIKDDSRGTYTVYDSSGNYLKWSSDMVRRWVIKKDVLHFGWMSMKEQRFTINQYPKTSKVQLVIPYDTIEIGQGYAIMDDQYFVKIK